MAVAKSPKIIMLDIKDECSWTMIFEIWKKFLKLI